MLTATTICIAMTACTPTPGGVNGTPNGTGTTNGTGGSTTQVGGTGTVGAGGSIGTGGNLTKADFIAYFTCYGNKYPQYKPSYDALIAQWNQIPDSTWAQISANYGTLYKEAFAAGCK